MERKRLKRCLTAIMLAIMMLISAFPTSVQAAAASGDWQITDHSVIYWVSTNDSQFEDADLKAQIQLFSQELFAKGLTTAPLEIIYGNKDNAHDSDILLYLSSEFGFAKEAYQIEISENGQLCIKASDADGLFYGCRHLIKALLSQSDLKNVAYIKPDYSERAFFLDCGRKYYSPEWIKDMIREISWSNMNAIYLHFSEEMGFRLESKTYPWLAGGDHTLCVKGADQGVAADNGKYITQDEMREIAQVAKLYHVEIIPSLDSPGHMNYAVKKYKEQCGTDIGNYFHYNGKTSIVQGSGPEDAQKNYSRGIDISNNEAVAFAQNLYKEYAAFFRELGCTKFDIGGDELLGWGSAVVSTTTKWRQLDHWKTYAQNRAKNEGITNYTDAVAYDAFMYYMNDIYDLVSGYGYTSIRMWNDDVLRSNDTGWKKVVNLNQNIEIQYWTPDANGSNNNIWTYLNAGYKAYNFLNSYNYYVLGAAHDGTGYEGLTEERIYENWAPNVFTPYGSDSTGKNTDVSNANIKGSAFCVWCDDPSSETADAVKSGTLPFIRVNGIKAWDADINSTVTFNEIKSYIGKIMDVPVISASTTVPKIEKYVYPDMTELNKEITAYQSTDASQYTEDSFNLYTAAAEKGNAVLTEKRPSKDEVSSAVSQLRDAKNALVPIHTVDFSGLRAELALFDDYNENDYTPETYTAYKNYVVTAQNLLESKDVDQSEIDNTVAHLEFLRKGLRKNDKIAQGDDWFLSFSAQSKTAYRGKVFVLTAYVRCEPDVTGFEIYDEAGNRVDFVRIIWANRVYLKNTKYGAQIRISADVLGEHTYTIYAVNRDGYRSPDSRKITVTVK